MQTPIQRSQMRGSDGPEKQSDLENPLVSGHAEGPGNGLKGSLALDEYLLSLSVARRRRCWWMLGLTIRWMLYFTWTM